MQTITLRHIIQPGSIIEFKQKDKNTVLNECATIGYKRLKKEHQDEEINAILVTKNGIIETRIEDYTKEIKHTHQLKHLKAHDHI